MLSICWPAVQTLLPSRSRGKLVVRLAQEKRRVDERLRQQEQQLQQMEGVHWVLQQDEMKRRMAWVQQLQKDVRERLSAAGVAGEQEQQRLVLEVGRAGVKTARVRAAGWWGCLTSTGLARVHMLPTAPGALQTGGAISLSRFMRTHANQTCLLCGGECP